METHSLGDLSEVAAPVAQWKVLVNMLHVREIVQQWLPVFFCFAQPWQP